MKIIFLFIFSLICFKNYSQQKTIICGKVKSDDKFLINFYEPINGYYNLASLDTLVQNSAIISGTDSIYKEIKIENPSFIHIYFRDAKGQFITVSDVLLFPGDSLHINFDLVAVDSLNSIVYSGSNSMGQKLFNEINYQPYNKYIPVFDALDKLPNNQTTLVKEIDSIVFSVTSRFDTLQKQYFITTEYLEYMNYCFKSLFYNEVINKFLRISKKRELIKKTSRDSIMSVLFEKQNPTDMKLKGLYLSPFYINNYYSYLSYKKYNLNSIKPLTDGDKIYLSGSAKFLIKEDFVPFTYIPDKKMKENLWALEIISFFSFFPGKYDATIISQYDSIFPSSKWKPLIIKQFESKYIDKNIGYSLQFPITFIDTANGIYTINSLLKKLPKGKAVFVDIWASWCGPCITAFGYNKELDSFLLKSGIEKLYISFDDEADIKKWKNAIQKYSLGGYHILINNLLKLEIRNNIYHSSGNHGMGIPRYILINKNGKVVIDDTFSPQDFKLLSNQITNTLSKEE